MVNKPASKALWLWNERRCEAIPKMECEGLIQNLSEQNILFSFFSLSCRCSEISVCISIGLMIGKCMRDLRNKIDKLLYKSTKE